MSHEEAAAKKREAAAGNDKNADGEVTAIGTGMGKHGEFTVEVSAKDGAIDRITVLDSRETPGMGDVAMEKMTQAIIDNQTLAVDTISGATPVPYTHLTTLATLPGLPAAAPIHRMSWLPHCTSTLGQERSSSMMSWGAGPRSYTSPMRWSWSTTRCWMSAASYTHLDVYKRQNPNL